MHRSIAHVSRHENRGFTQYIRRVETSHDTPDFDVDPSERLVDFDAPESKDSLVDRRLIESNHPETWVAFRRDDLAREVRERGILLRRCRPDERDVVVTLLALGILESRLGKLVELAHEYRTRLDTDGFEPTSSNLRRSATGHHEFDPRTIGRGPPEGENASTDRRIPERCSLEQAVIREGQ